MVTYRRRKGIDLREVGDEIFLIDPRYGRIHHLNPTGAALWRLLDGPLSLDEIVETFRDAFPGSTRRAHKKHLKRILDDLEDNELIERPPADP